MPCRRSPREANPNRTAQHVMLLKNVLGRDAAYRQGRAAIQDACRAGGRGDVAFPAAAVPLMPVLLLLTVP